MRQEAANAPVGHLKRDGPAPGTSDTLAPVGFRKIMVGLFWTCLASEVVMLLVIFGVPIGGFAGAALITIPFWLGLFGSMLGSLPKPRLRSAVVSLGIHVAFACLVLAWPSLESIADGFDERAEERTEQRERELLKQRQGFKYLIVSGRSQDAQTYLKQHPDIDLSDIDWLQGLFCRLGEKPLDQGVLRSIRSHGKLKDGDILSAAAKCSPAAVQAVLDLGVPVGAVASDGRKALMTGTSVAALALLVERGAAVNARDDNGATALMYHRTPEITRFLLEHGADVNALDKSQESALFYWSDQHMAECYALLIAAGADAKFRNRWEGTPLLALTGRRWNQGVADLLVQHGADPMASRDGLTVLERVTLSKEELAASLRWPSLNLRGPYGAKLLVRAIRVSHWDDVEALLDAGVSPTLAAADGQVPRDLFRTRWGKIADSSDGSDEHERQLKMINRRFLQTN